MKSYSLGGSMLLKELNKIVSNKYNILFFLLIIFSFAIRFYFRSNYLDDWDSVQFVMGLEEYSIPAHQPHPPGYPLYIFIGHIFYFFIGDSLTTFTLISAIFGTLALIPTYLISKEIFDERVGLLSAVLLSFAPAQMLFSEVVMTDIVSLFFVTFTAYLLYLGIRSTKYLYFGALMVGITAGIRMTDIIMVTMLLLILLYMKDLRKCFISGLLVLIGISAWLIPITLHTGLDTLISVQRSQWSYASGEASTLSSLGGLSLLNLFLTFKVYINLLIEGWSYAILVFILAVFALLSVKLRRNTNITCNTLQFGAIFILCWLLIYLLFSNFFNLLYISRYLLPQFPPMAIIFSASILRLVDMQHTKWFKTLLSSIFLISIIFMGIQGVMAINAIHTSSPPPVDAANLIMERYDPDEIIIIAWESFRHFQYYLPDYDVRLFNWYLICTVDDKNKVIISDIPITIYESNKIYNFKRGHNIYPKHSYVELYETRNETDNKIYLIDNFNTSLPKSHYKIDMLEINEVRKISLYQHPYLHDQSRISFENITIPKKSTLNFSIALDPQVWSQDKGDGVRFDIYILQNETESIIFSEYIDPKNNHDDRIWNDFEIDLSEYADRDVTVILSTLPGSGNDLNHDYDWAWWGKPTIIWE